MIFIVSLLSKHPWRPRSMWMRGCNRALDAAQPSPRCRPQPSWRSLKDVAAADGWQDTETLLKCYQQPDNQALPRRPAAIWSSTDNLDFNQDPNIARPISKNSRRHLPSTRRSSGAVAGADCEKADGVYLKRPPPAQAPCPRANRGLHLATRPTSGRVALAPRRCAVTRA